MYYCFLCQTFRSSTFAAVVHHIGAVHAFEPSFNISCGIDGCPRHPYNNFVSYKKHLYRHHPEVLSTHQTASSTTLTDESSCSPNISLEGDIAPITDEEQSDVCTFSSSQEDDIKRSAALFILKTAELCKLTLTSVNHILGDVQQLVERSVLDVRQKIEAAVPK